MQLVWSSPLEKEERLKHSLKIFAACVFLISLLFLISVNSISVLESKPAPKYFSWIAKISLVLIGICFSHKSLGELLQLVSPPILYKRTRKYHFLFTGLTLAPLVLLALTQVIPSPNGNGGQGNGKEQVAKITHYLAFQCYFLGANWVAWAFFNKFLPEAWTLPEDEKKLLKKTGGRLLRWHYLGWTSFFSLSICFPTWTVVLCTCISFFNNSLSFLIGRKIGRKQLSILSPNKTVEGCLGSIILSLFVFGIFSSWFVNSGAFSLKGLKCQLPYWFTPIWVLAVSIISHLGDNSFSACKRVLGYKNFGRMFGQQIGGFWDRADSLAPIFFFTSLVMWSFFAISNKTIGF